MTHLTLPPTREGSKIQPAINEKKHSPCAGDPSAARRGHEDARRASIWGAPAPDAIWHRCLRRRLPRTSRPSLARAPARTHTPLRSRRLPVPGESARAGPAPSSTAEPSPFPKCHSRRLKTVSAGTGTEGRAAAACLEESSKVGPKTRGWRNILPACLKRSLLKIKRGYFDPAYGTLHHLERAARQMARVRRNLPSPAPATVLGASSRRVCSTPGAFQGLFEAREIGKQERSAPLTGTLKEPTASGTGKAGA